MYRGPKEGTGGLQLVGVDSKHRQPAIQQALYEDALGAFYGHPLHAHLNQRATQLFDASLLMGEAALQKHSPGCVEDAEGVLVFSPVYPAALLLVCSSILEPPPPPLPRWVAFRGRRRGALCGCGLDEDEVPLRMLIGRRSVCRCNALLPLLWCLADAGRRRSEVGPLHLGLAFVALSRRRFRSRCYDHEVTL